MRIVLALVIGIASGGCVMHARGGRPDIAHVDHEPAPVAVTHAPPRGGIEAVPPPPGPGHAWVTGYWHWEQERWVWVEGRWIVVERGRRWVPPRCTRDGPRWRYLPGHFRRAPESEAATTGGGTHRAPRAPDSAPTAAERAEPRVPTAVAPTSPERAEPRVPAAVAPTSPERAEPRAPERGDPRVPAVAPTSPERAEPRAPERNEPREPESSGSTASGRTVSPAASERVPRKPGAARPRDSGDAGKDPVKGAATTRPAGVSRPADEPSAEPPGRVPRARIRKPGAREAPRGEPGKPAGKKRGGSDTPDLSNVRAPSGDRPDEGERTSGPRGRTPVPREEPDVKRDGPPPAQPDSGASPARARKARKARSIGSPGEAQPAPAGR